MRKVSKILSFVLLLALLISVCALTGYAAEEKKVEASSRSKVVVSNVLEEKEVDGYTVFVTKAPVKVTFEGSDLCDERVYFYPEGFISGNFVRWGETAISVNFDVMKYKYFEEDTVYDMNTQPPEEDIVLMVSGNYATIDKPGLYSVSARPEAVAGAFFLIQVAEGTSEPTPTPVPTPTPAPTPTPTTKPETPATVKVKPTPSTVIVNGKVIPFEAYGFGGYNYFKLRDLAMAVSGSEKQFEVTWDGVEKVIRLTSGLPYTKTGGELTISSNFVEKEAKLNTAKIFADGAEVELVAYGIDGYNYFKLRDIGKLFDFGVEWDAKNNAVIIDTSKPYTE